MKTMIETRTITIGNKTFEIRKTIPYQVTDLAIRELDKLEKIESDETRGIASLKLRNLIMCKMVLKPKIDDKYLEDEADMDDMELSFDLLAEVAEAIESRFNIIKKKHPRLFDGKPAELGKDGF